MGGGVLLSTAKGLRRQAAVALPAAGRRGRAGGTYTTDRESSADRFPVTGLPPPFLLPLEFKAIGWAPVPRYNLPSPFPPPLPLPASSAATIPSPPPQPQARLSTSAHYPTPSLSYQMSLNRSTFLSQILARPVTYLSKGLDMVAPSWSFCYLYNLLHK